MNISIKTEFISKEREEVINILSMAKKDIISCSTERRVFDIMEYYMIVYPWLKITENIARGTVTLEASHKDTNIRCTFKNESRSK